MALSACVWQVALSNFLDGRLYGDLPRLAFEAQMRVERRDCGSQLAGRGLGSPFCQSSSRKNPTDTESQVLINSVRVNAEEKCPVFCAFNIGGYGFPLLIGGI
ncbi:hypothetical protein CBM2598_U10286 [Cupriavidus taiwanensis]|uniref:Uncharacterized protein n=1 Tax=Cupriavidus taiwanensis TaxID=164546 RepID=A0A7Z7JFE2_9BURK|nr:hypothetical protein CBM2597_U10065 [Cupriavidus taiwanensis]SOZ96496.1 hypothetical protein CBM2598_U10286 [Cupriavidus taiwanensis]SPC25571.1 hypothetical protein CBM2594_U10072 [Cupriavidus taiwanensis]